MLTKWNNKTNTVKVKDILIFLFWYFARIVTFLLFFHDYCMIMLYFDLLLFFLICYCYNLPFIFPQEYICKIIYIFFLLLLRCQIEFKCLHTSVYVYIVHVLLLTNIDCTWLNIESELSIRPRDYQIVYSFIYTSPVQRFNAHLINSLCFFFSIHLYI